jgi:hypothetical protein
MEPQATLLPAERLNNEVREELSLLAGQLKSFHYPGFAQKNLLQLN